jgi:hypothetical protein
VPRLKFTLEAAEQLRALKENPASAATHDAVTKALGYLEVNPRHPGLHTHEYTSLRGARGEKVFEAYAQNRTPGAYRIFWHYGPDELKPTGGGKKKRGGKIERIAVITVITITPHP